MMFIRNKKRALAEWQSSRRGFSLVETIIYLVLLMMLLVAIINFLLFMSKSWASIRVDKGIAYTASTALERMTREIKDADRVDTSRSIFNDTHGKLTLDVYTTGGATTSLAFFLNGTTLVMQNASGTTPLALSTTPIQNLTFEHIVTPQSEGVEIAIQLESDYMGRSRTEFFYATAIVRNSYQN